MKKMNKKGFTLAELLIVVAIIAVLVAIAIPIFSSQLEKAKVATDQANIRSAYAEAAADVLDDGKLDKASLTVGKIACTASFDSTTEVVTITVARGAGQQSKTYENGVTYANGQFTAGTATPAPSPSSNPEG
jgi:prepilin-type N-terminal cleavage/methylation domain-containing protein